MIGQFDKQRKIIQLNIRVFNLKQLDEGWNIVSNCLTKLNFIPVLVISRWYMGINSL
jgi:hypothetical protein